jgi:hypothetical protein
VRAAGHRAAATTQVKQDQSIQAQNKVLTPLLKISKLHHSLGDFLTGARVSLPAVSSV